MGFQYHTPGTTVTEVSASTSLTKLLEENPNRKGFMIYNESTSILYLKLGENATTSSFTTKVAAEDYWETPYGYSGAATGVWVTANGTAHVTEIF